MWEENPEAELVSSPPPAKLTDPVARREWWDRVWGLWGPVRGSVVRAEPSVAHKKIAQLEEVGKQVVVVTQNVDGLHQEAGSTEVVELHGNLLRTKCSRRDCKSPARVDKVAHLVAPVCERCGRAERPDVVLFSEGLDGHSWDKAEWAVRGSEVVVVVGSSGAVYPANLLVGLRGKDTTAILVGPGAWMGREVEWDAEFKGTADEFFCW